MKLFHSALVKTSLGLCSPFLESRIAYVSPKWAVSTQPRSVLQELARRHSESPRPGAGRIPCLPSYLGLVEALHVRCRGTRDHLSGAGDHTRMIAKSAA